MSDLTAVSLFAGIEGFGLALQHAGTRVTAAVEIDPAARGVIADRLPTTALFDDVCEVTADDIRATGFDPDRGVLTAGWPCQDLSVAGRRLGLGGARSGLFWEVVRLLADLRPRWFILENVPGLLSAVCSCPGSGFCGGWTERDEWGRETRHACDEPHPVPSGACGFDGRRGRCMDLHGGAMGAVVGALADLGYGLCWRVLDAQYLGVPQRRRRVVFVGCAGDGAAPVEVLLEPEGRRGDSPTRRTARARATGVAALSASGGGADDNGATGGRLIVAPLRAANPYGDQVAAESHLLAGPLQAQRSDVRGYRIDAEGAASNHLVAATLTAGSHSGRPPGRRREDDENIVAGTVSAKWAKGTGGPAGDEAQNLIPFVPLSGQGVTHALTAEGHDASEDGTGRGTPLVPVAYQCQGSNVGEAGAQRASNGHVTGGVPFVPQGVGLHGELSWGGEVSASVTASHGQPPGLVEASAVRRLTPVECERLQGFPDGWTATSDGAPQSDSARYRQLGNSIAVPVFAWVARRLVAVDAALRAEVPA